MLQQVGYIFQSKSWSKYICSTVSKSCNTPILVMCCLQSNVDVVLGVSLSTYTSVYITLSFYFVIAFS